MSEYEIYQISYIMGYTLGGAIIFSGIPLIISIFKRKLKTGLLIFALSALAVNIHLFAPLPVAIIGTVILFQNKKTNDISAMPTNDQYSEKIEDTSNSQSSFNSDISSSEMKDYIKPSELDIEDNQNQVQSINTSTSTNALSSEGVILIKQIKELYDQGILTEEEYTSKKTEILKRL